jgi:hypothetical protein
MQSFTKRYGRWGLLATLLLSPALYADTAHVAEDAHIDLGSPQVNNGGVPNLAVSNIVDKKNGERLTFVSFDLPALPDGASLEEARLRLFVGKVGSEGDIDAYLVTGSWDEHGITGDTAPVFEALPFTTFSVASGDEGHFLAVDVTPEVQAWLDGANDNHGFVLVANPGMEVDVTFDSKENSQTSHQSELELVLGTAAGGIDSDDIADDSITSDDIADGTIGSSDIADGSIGGADVDKDAIQLRISGTCAAGSSIREIGNMGAVVCEPDDDSGGDITAVWPTAGAGLTGGADSGDAYLGIAPGGVDTAKIAGNAVTAAKVDASSVQLRVAGTCPSGSSIRTISPAGAVTCEVDNDTDTTLDPDLFWQVGGNAGTSPIPAGPNFIGTTDDTELVLGVNGVQAMRLATASNLFTETVNVLGGHPVNKIVNAMGATIGGGGSASLVGGTDHPNKVEASYGTIGGGRDNGVLNSYGFIGGGQSNLIGPSSGTDEVRNSVIAGGNSNTIEQDADEPWRFTGDSFIGGGFSNTIVGAPYATIGGGVANAIFIERAFIGGGTSNRICDPDSFPDADPFDDQDAILGGYGNQSCGGWAAVLGGYENLATHHYAVVVGGYRNEALGRGSLAAGIVSKANEDYSFALGSGANADHEGAFVWGDNSRPGGILAEVHSERDNQFRVRATGGARFDVGDDQGSYGGGDQWVDIRTQANNSFPNPADFRLIDTSTGAYLSLGGGWVNASDRKRKTDIRDVDAHWILEQVAALPIQSWRYKVDHETVRHIGPMAQDFQASFGFGGDPKGIMSVDADGVALAAIQALYRMTVELERRTRQLEAQQQRLDNLEASLRALEARLDPFDGQRLARAEVRLGSE